MPPPRPAGRVDRHDGLCVHFLRGEAAGHAESRGLRALPDRIHGHGRRRGVARKSVQQPRPRRAFRCVDGPQKTILPLLRELVRPRRASRVRRRRELDLDARPPASTALARGADRLPALRHRATVSCGGRRAPLGHVSGGVVGAVPTRKEPPPAARGLASRAGSGPQKGDARDRGSDETPRRRALAARTPGPRRTVGAIPRERRPRRRRGALAKGRRRFTHHALRALRHRRRRDDGRPNRSRRPRQRRAAPGRRRHDPRPGVAGRHPPGLRRRPRAPHPKPQSPSLHGSAGPRLRPRPLLRRRLLPRLPRPPHRPRPFFFF
mmetsp:Transcript_25868/g.79621  ORF Transcript_25868/g.79621 Transcript_25868/m.79621 type:complete len:321 (+) Transcript_25868:307-1269(+)